MMTHQADVVTEIYLHPGELHFGGKNTRIHTVLGSCVSIALWHPVLRIGGMCHFVLPNRGKPGNHKLDGHYADEAIQLIRHETIKRNTRPDEYHVKLFGGGNMFQQAIAEKTSNIARDNIEAARALLDINGFNIHAEHVGGSGHRRIIFDLRNGNVWVRHAEIPISPGQPQIVGRVSTRHVCPEPIEVVGLALHSQLTKPQAASRWLKPDLRLMDKLE